MASSKWIALCSICPLVLSLQDLYNGSYPLSTSINLKMETEMNIKILEQFQQVTQLNPKIQSYTLVAMKTSGWCKFLIYNRQNSEIKITGELSYICLSALSTGFHFFMSLHSLITKLLAAWHCCCKVSYILITVFEVFLFNLHFLTYQGWNNSFMAVV